MLASYDDSFGLIEFGRTVAVEYGRLRAATEALGRRVASNDLWIAASATANGLPLDASVGSGFTLGRDRPSLGSDRKEA